MWYNLVQHKRPDSSFIFFTSFQDICVCLHIYPNIFTFFANWQKTWLAKGKKFWDWCKVLKVKRIYNQKWWFRMKSVFGICWENVRIYFWLNEINKKFWLCCEDFIKKLILRTLLSDRLWPLMKDTHFYGAVEHFKIVYYYVMFLSKISGKITRFVTNPCVYWSLQLANSFIFLCGSIFIPQTALD